jgi:hypothetical protein
MSKKLKFEKIKSNNDIEKVYNYDVEVFTETPDFDWTLDSIKQEVKDGWELYAVTLGEEILAAAFLKEVEGKGLLTKNTPIKMIYQGNGYSHRIKDFFEETAKKHKNSKVYHYCSSHNFRMISLNESHGYIRTPQTFDGLKYMTEWEKPIKKTRSK